MQVPSSLRSFALAVAAAGSLSSHAFIIPPPPPSVSEYLNDITGHYVLLDREEAAVVQQGGAGPGWHPTGHSFEIWPGPAGAAPICRFYSPIHNSHFFTGSASECEGLKQLGGEWIYEKIAFHIQVPVAGTCTHGTPVYRLYNQRHAFGDANHRFSADAAVRSEMIASGWRDEGIAFCTPFPSYSPEYWLAYSGATMAAPGECEAMAGGCVALWQVPPLTTFIRYWMPPWYVTANPGFPAGLEHLTGTSHTSVYTGQPESAHQAIRAHSFIQGESQAAGIYINGADRLSGPYASVTPMHVLPAAAGERMHPWASRDRALEIGFDLKVPTLARADASSHAYGGAILRFTDAQSGRSFYLTLQAYGSVPPGDFAAADAKTGRPIVSTVFRADPAFGERVSGEFAACSGSSTCMPQEQSFRFRMRRADLAKVIDRARAIDPALSMHVADYYLAHFGLHNETYLDARLGLTVNRLQLKLHF